VQRTLIRPPMSRVGPATAAERTVLVAADADNQRKYKDAVDAESAYERLQAKNTTVGQLKDKLRSFGGLFRSGQ